MTIKKGESIGIIGKTGSGKTTFLDIIMGFMIPTDGYISIDKNKLNDKNIVSWRSSIAHVPQNIFLLDATVIENIAFGEKLEAIDNQKALKAAKIACLDKLGFSGKNGIFKNIGELGSQISGGQRQRIGIARAIYKDVDLLIMDEATSALDKETERAIIENIKKYLPSLTLIIVAHKYSALVLCNKIYELRDKNLKYIGGPESIT